MMAHVIKRHQKKRNCIPRGLNSRIAATHTGSYAVTIESRTPSMKFVITSCSRYGFPINLCRPLFYSRNSISHRFY